MANRRDNSEETPKPDSKGHDEAWRAFQSFVNLFTTLVQKVGWPGTVAICFMYCFLNWPTEDQKHKIISMFVLGEGLPRLLPNLILAIIFLVVLMEQRRSYRKKLKVLDDEIQRLGSEKSKLQEKAAGRALKHSNHAGGK